MADAQVAAWLRHAGLSRFSPRFAAALVSVPIFLQLSPSDLDALGVDGPADRKRLADLIADLRRASPTAPAAPAAPTSASAAPRRHASPPRANTALGLGLRRASERAPAGAMNRRLSRANSLSAATAAAAAAAASGRRDSPSPPRLARVTVVVRKRPLSRKELASADKDVVSVDAHTSALYVHELREKVDLTKYVDTHPFAFDRVFGEHAANDTVYDGTARPLVDTLFDGGRATCFAYGQTGAGKTFTMAGDGSENPGLYTLAVRDVFDRIRRVESELWRKAEADGIDDFEPPDPAQVWISFYEIYSAKLYDLLNRSAKLECREDSNNEVQIVGLSQRLCEVEEDVLSYIEEGSAARSTGVTGANDDSSRSHAVFQIELRHPPTAKAETDVSTVMKESLLRNTRSRTAAAVNQAKRGAEIGRLCFIDLAGSERGSDTASSTRQTRMEGAEINKSLLALKECIRAMDQRKDHTPFRGSKLTQVLKASFTGKNCSTVMIANISPASSNVEHTLNTLRYSDRVKEMKRDKNESSNPANEMMMKSLGGRRATFSHGIGLRAGRSTLAAATPLRTTQRQASFDLDRSSDDVHRFTEQPKMERKSSKTHNSSRQPDRPPDKNGKNGTHSLPRTGSRSGRRTLLRSRSRDSEKRAQESSADGLVEQKATKKPRETRLTRRRTSRAPSMIPSRPSLSGASLTLSTRDEKATAVRIKSGMGQEQPQQVLEDPSRPCGIENKAPEQDYVKGQSMTSSRVVEPEARALHAPAPVPPSTQVPETREETRTSESDQKGNDSSQSLDTSASDAEKDTGRRRMQRRRTVKSGNAADSAMKYYMTNRKDELPEEDLLFPSSDNLVDEATAAAQERLCAAVAETNESVPVPKNQPVPETRAVKPAAQSASAGAAAVRTTTDAGTSPPTSDDNSGNETFVTSATKPSSVRQQSEALTKVIRFHHIQIEELMRLTESDVALVNAAEKGEMDADEYALKLKLNLTQKMDIVKTLQSKLNLLE